nr:reverse transcriptase domain-containing protein [Tanacetum cinerariifolium]
MVTKLRNEITDFRQKPNESLLEAWERYKLSIDRCPNHNMLLVTPIDTFYNGLTLRHWDTINAAAGRTFMQKTLEECYDLIENITAHHNHWDTSAPRDETSRTISSTTTTQNYETNMRAMQSQINTMRTEIKKDFDISMAKNQNELKNMMSSFLQMQMQSPSGSRSLPSNNVANPRGDIKAITTRSGVSYDGPTIPPTHSPLMKEVERETEGTKCNAPLRKEDKYGYSKDNCELNFKFLNNLQPEWKQYATMMRQNKNLMNINIDTLYNILKQNQGDVNDAIGSKKKTVAVTSDLLAFIAEKMKVSKSKEKVVVSSDSKGSKADDFSELKKITALLAKAFNRRKFYSKPTNNNLRTSSTFQSTNKKQEFVKTDDKKVEKKANEKKRDMSRVKCYNCKKKRNFSKDCKKVKVKDYEYYKTKMLLAKKDKDEKVLLAEDQGWMESSSDLDQEINANMVFMAQIEKTVHMIMPSKDNLYNGRKGIGFENSSYFEKAKDLRPMLYDENVIGLGYTLMFLTHSDEALEIEKFKRSRENKIEFAYDFENLNASYVNEKINFRDDYFHEIINPDFEKIDSLFQQTSSLKPYVLNVILEKIIIDLEDEIKKKRSSNTSNVGLSAISVSNLNKNVKQYSRKELLACNNSHLGETSSAYVCNDVMNVSYSPRMYNLLDDNNFFIFDNESVRISPVSKMPFRKK